MSTELLLKLIISTILFLDIPLAIASFIFAFILLSRRKDKIYFNFGMANLFLGLWILVTFLVYMNFSQSVTNLLIMLSFVFGLWILHYFCIFSYYFPFRSSNNTKIIGLFYIVTSLFTLSFFVPNLYINEARLIFPFLYERPNMLGLTLFVIYFLILTGLSFKNFVSRYFSTDGIHKIQLKKIIFGTSIAIIANIIFSLCSLYFVPYDLTVVGVLFTSAVLIYIYSILFQK